MHLYVFVSEQNSGIVPPELAIWHMMDLFIFSKRRLQIFKRQRFLIVHVIGPNSSTCMGNEEWEPDPREVRCIRKASNVLSKSGDLSNMLYIPV